MDLHVVATNVTVYPPFHAAQEGKTAQKKRHETCCPEDTCVLTELHFKFLVLIKAGKDSLLTVALCFTET